MGSETHVLDGPGPWDSHLPIDERTVGSVFLHPLANRSPIDDATYPDGYDHLCTTCCFLAGTYGPDDGELKTHCENGRHTSKWIKIGHIEAGSITYNHIVAETITYSSPNTDPGTES